jgi:hypothetical protein
MDEKEKLSCSSSCTANNTATTYATDEQLSSLFVAAAETAENATSLTPVGNQQQKSLKRRRKPDGLFIVFIHSKIYIFISDYYYYYYFDFP